MSERKAEEQWLAGRRQLHPGAGWPGDGIRHGAAQHGGRHPQDGADYQEYPGAAARGSGEQTRQVSRVSKGSSSFLSPAARGHFWANGHCSALCSSISIVDCFATMLCCLHPWPITLSCCYDPALCRCVPAPTASPSPPMEQTMWAKRRCASSQAQPRMFQHAGALGWEGPPSPPATQPPVPWPRLLVLWPLSLPPRHSFLFLSVTKHLIHPLGLSPPLLTSLPCGVLCSRSFTVIPEWLILCNDTQLCKVAPLHGVDFMGFCDWYNTFAGRCCFCGVAQLSTYSADKKKEHEKLTWKQRCYCKVWCKHCKALVPLREF